MTPDDRSAAWAHLKQLATDHGIRLHTAKSRWRSEAHLGTRQVWVPKHMRAPIDYLIGLHEFGHILSPMAVHLHSNHMPMERTAAMEAAAWAWAIQAAEPEVFDEVTEKDWRLVAEAMVSHIRPEV